MRKYITGIVFSAILWIMMIGNIVVADKEVSEFQKRRLQMFPQFSIQSYVTGNFMEQLDTYVKDQEVLSESFSKIVSFVNYTIFRKIENRNIVKYNKSLYEPIKFQKYNIDDFTNNLLKLQHIYKHKKQYTVILPDKSFYLHHDIPHVNPQVLKKLNFEFIDFSDIVDASDFYKTDIHINNKGSYKIYLQLKEKMKLKEEYPIHFEKVSDDFLGYYAIKSMYTGTKDSIFKPTNEIMDKIEVRYMESNGEFSHHTGCYFDEHLETLDQYSFHLNGNKPVTILHNPSIDNNKELVIVKDSYGLTIAPYLAQHYKKVTLIDVRMLPIHAIMNYVTDETEMLYYYGFRSINAGKMI